jgi:hypothetical protein
MKTSCPSSRRYVIQRKEKPVNEELETAALLGTLLNTSRTEVDRLTASLVLSPVDQLIKDMEERATRTKARRDIYKNELLIDYYHHANGNLDALAWALEELKDIRQRLAFLEKPTVSI